MDGVNLLSLGLNEVRGRIAAIPQDPVLFSGTVRSNLDPFDRYADADLGEALHLVNLHVRHQPQCRFAHAFYPEPQTQTHARLCKTDLSADIMELNIQYM